MKQNYKDCATPLNALILYQSNVRQILITSTDDRARIENLWDNDRDFLNWLTGDNKNANTCTNQEV